MKALIFKEISCFFSSITGYLVIVVFLLINSLVMWVFPGNMNVLEGGYATLDSLFTLAPWVFLFLVPAVTMRMFAEEKKSGTMEMLLTRPITDLQIIMSKYIAGLVLVFFAIIPTFIYFISIYLLGNPIGNIDVGATWGSFIGLFFLASIYVAAGIFASSISDNQIIAFIIAMLLSFILYMGFDFLASVYTSGAIQQFISSMGIDYHYRSMSRGVIDSRDVLFFIGEITLVIFSTRTVLQSTRW